jgi:hypothetical protein
MQMTFSGMGNWPFAVAVRRPREVRLGLVSDELLDAADVWNHAGSSCDGGGHLWVLTLVPALVFATLMSNDCIAREDVLDLEGAEVLAATSGVHEEFDQVCEHRVPCIAGSLACFKGSDSLPIFGRPTYTGELR